MSCAKFPPLFLKTKQDTNREAGLSDGTTDFTGWTVTAKGRNINTDEELFDCPVVEKENIIGSFKNSIAISKENTDIARHKSCMLEIIYTDTNNKQTVGRLELKVCL
jgi:hypothetical protein